MAFQRPGLYTTISADTYQTEIDANFNAINTAFIQIQNELAALSGSSGSSGVSNLSWVDLQLKQDGPIGFNSWLPQFAEETDGWVLTLTHSSTEDRVSSAIISGLLHRSSTDQEFNLDDIVPPAGDGPFRIAIGLNSVGAPGVEYSVVHNEAPTDDPELLLFTCQYVRETDGPRIINLRREALWLSDEDSWSEVRDRRTLIQASTQRFDDGFWPNDDMHAVIIIPFDCRVVSAHGYMSHMPQGGEIIEIVLERFGFTSGLGADDRSERVHQGSWLFNSNNQTDSDSVQEVVEKSAASPEVQLDEGDYVNIKLLQGENITTDNPINPESGFPETRKMFTAQIGIVPIQHDPRKGNPT